MLTAPKFFLWLAPLMVGVIIVSAPTPLLAQSCQSLLQASAKTLEGLLGVRYSEMTPADFDRTLDFIGRCRTTAARSSDAGRYYLIEEQVGRERNRQFEKKLRIFTQKFHALINELRSLGDDDADIKRFRTLGQEHTQLLRHLWPEMYNKLISLTNEFVGLYQQREMEVQRLKADRVTKKAISDAKHRMETAVQTYGARVDQFGISKTLLDLPIVLTIEINPTRWITAREWLSLLYASNDMTIQAFRSENPSRFEASVKKSGYRSLRFVFEKDGDELFLAEIGSSVQIYDLSTTRDRRAASMILLTTIQNAN